LLLQNGISPRAVLLFPVLPRSNSTTAFFGRRPVGSKEDLSYCLRKGVAPQPGTSHWGFSFRLNGWCQEHPNRLRLGSWCCGEVTVSRDAFFADTLSTQALPRGLLTARESLSPVSGGFMVSRRRFQPDVLIRTNKSILPRITDNRRFDESARVPLVIFFFSPRSLVRD